MSAASSTLPEGRVRVTHVLRLAWPVLVSMLSVSAMSLADTLFVGWLGTAELAAVGLAATLSFYVLTPGRGLLRGLKILTSQRVGAEDRATADRLVSQALWLGGAFGLVVALLAPIGPTLFWLLGASDSVATHATAYFSVRALFAPVALIAWGIEGWFQGKGDTVTPMVANVAGNVLNIVLDPLLIFGVSGVFPALGIAGAAWATGIAQGAMLLILGVRAWPTIRRNLALQLGLIRQAMRLGVPLAVQWTLDFSGFLVFLSLLARSGDAHLAAHVMVFRIVQVSMLPGFAIGDAAGVLVGQAYGARRPQAAREAWWAALWPAVVFMGAFGLLFLVAPTWFLVPFGPSTEVAELAIVLLGLAALWQVADAVVMVNYCSLAGAGDTRFTLALFVGGSWLVQVPATLILVGWFDYGAVGAWWALTAEIVVVSVISLVRVRGRGWLEGALQREEQREGAEGGAAVAAPVASALPDDGVPALTEPALASK